MTNQGDSRSMKPFVTILIFFVLVTSSFAAEDIDTPEPASQGTDPSILDSSHDYLVSFIDDPIIWFDSFFGDERMDEENLPVTFIRLRLVTRYTEGDGFTFPVRVRASVRMPNLNKKFRFIVIGASADESRSILSDDSSDLVDSNGNRGEKTNVGLRYSIYQSLREYISFGGGLRFSLPLEYYVRVRYRRFLHIGEVNVVRFSETGFWNSLDGFGETSRLDFDRKLTKTTSGRLSFIGTYSNISQGVDWGSEANIFKKLNKKSALSFDLGAYGRTRPVREVTTYRVGLRYRRNIYRPWLFVELAPEESWVLQDDTGERDAIAAISLVLEVQFVN